MKSLRSILFAVLLIIFIVGCSTGTTLQEPIENKAYEQEAIRAKELTIEEKLEDFEYLFKVITENYPYLEVNKRTNGIDWVANKELYQERIMNTKSDIEFYDTLNSILRDINNYHTDIPDRNFVQMAREVYYYALDKFPENWVEMLFENINNNLVTERYELEEFNMRKEEKNFQEDAVENREIINARAQDIIKDKVAYIHIPKMIQPYERKIDEELIDNYLYEIKDYEALVIDIRDNGGGNTSYWIDFLVPRIADKTYKSETYTFYRDGEIINKYVKHQPKYEEFGEGEFYKISDLDKNSIPMLPPEVHNSFKYYRKRTLVIEPDSKSINFKGNVYLLVDGGVYSAAESFSVFAKQSGFATLVGERTLGGGVGSDPWIEMLPNSGYLFKFEKEMGTTANGTCNEEHRTIPHYEVNATSVWDDLLNDTSIKKILELEGMIIEN